MFPIPKSVFLTRGVGVHRQRLSAFEYAVRDADIEQQNLVSVSSILPANCEMAGIGLARPKDPGHYGYISEHHCFGMTEAETTDYVEDLAATMRASTLGIEFNPDAAWDERKRVYEMSDLLVDSLSITAFAEGASNHDWTCAVAAAVFRFAAPAPGES